MWLPIITFIGSLIGPVVSTVGNIGKSLLPYIFETLMRYKGLLIWSLFFGFALHFVSPMLAYILYTVNMTIILFLANFFHPFSVGLVVYTIVSVLVLFV